MKTTIALCLALLITACGPSEEEQAKLDAKKKEEGKAEVAQQKVDQEKARVEQKLGGHLEGYLVSAFDLTVDGKQYPDSEAFYTEQLGRIEADVKAGGYEGYVMRFDAELGLNDLKRGMRVYVASTDQAGFAGEGPLWGNGAFMIAVPNGSGGDSTFKVRSAKRITIQLTKYQHGTSIVDQVKWCYNFSGLATDATLKAPAIISTFETRITRYACDASAAGGITIPAKQDKADSVPEAAGSSDAADEQANKSEA